MGAAVEHVILYGTLRRGETTFERLGLGRRLGLLRPVRFRGTLHDLGAYPAVILEPAQGWVRGELYRILDPAVLAEMDDYELYRPDDLEPYSPATGRGSLYRRQIIRSGTISAFVYVFNGRPDGPRIVSGDWRRR